jgi:cytoskeleton protein RodZ
MMNTQQDNQISNMDSNKEPSLSVGQTLREAREQLGLSVNDVANRIKFAPRQVESLEADDYVQLPEAAFVRGFVRSYARLLDLDPSRLLSGLPSSHMQAASTQEVSSVDIPLPTPFSARRHNIIWLAAALAIALALAIFERLHDTPEVAEPVAKTNVQPLELPDDATDSTSARLPERIQPAAPVPSQTVRAVQAPAVQKPVPPKAVTTAPKPATAAPVAQTLQPPQQAAGATPAPAVVAAPAAPTPVPQQPAPPKAVSTAPLSPAWQPVPQATVRAAPESAEQPVVNAEVSATEHALRLEFDEDAWVEVKDGTDKVLISRMYTAGSLVRVKGKAPMLLTIGNSQAVRVFDNGKQLKPGRPNSSGVARMTLN